MSRGFTSEVIVPGAEEIERTREYPYDIMEQMAELGMMGNAFFQRNMGGAEEAGSGCTSVSRRSPVAI